MDLLPVESKQDERHAYDGRAPDAGCRISNDSGCQHRHLPGIVPLVGNIYVWTRL